MRASKRAQVRQATRLIAANYRGYRGSSSPLCASTIAFRLLRRPLAKIRPCTRFQFPFQGFQCIVLFISRVSSSVRHPVRIFGTMLKERKVYTDFKFVGVG